MIKQIKDPAVYLWDMLYEINFIQRTAAAGSVYDDLTGRALLRAFTVLGEAAKRVDETTKASTPNISWQKIVDTRNFISHEYESINLNKIELLIKNNIPALKHDLLVLYQKLTGEEYAENIE